MDTDERPLFDEPERLLSELTRLRVSTRRGLGSPVYALVCFGAVSVIAGVAALLAGSIGLLVVWVIGGLAAVRLTGVAYRRRGRGRGLVGRRRIAWAWSIGLFAGCFAVAWLVGRTGGDSRGVVAVVCLVAVVYAVFGAWQRSARSALPGIAAAIAPCVLAGLGAGAWLVELVYGLSLLAAGAALYRLDERDAPPEPPPQR